MQKLVVTLSEPVLHQGELVGAVGPTWRSTS